MTICRSIVLNILRAHPDGVTTSYTGYKAMKWIYRREAPQ